MTGEAPALPPGWRLAAFERLDSTNAEAARQARAGAADRTIVWSREQTGGRGRSGRPWRSPPGNLYCSLLLRPQVAPPVAAQLSFVAALAVGELAAAALPGDAAIRLKWPNDVLVGERKLSGILLEASAAASGRLDWLIVGIGVNLRHHPEGTETPATDIVAAGGRAPDPAAALGTLVGWFDRWRRAWERGGFAPVREAWLARAWRLGEEIRVRLDRETSFGRFAGIDSEGALVLELPSGLQRRIAAGEVFPATA